MTDERKQQIRERAERATYGPWRVGMESSYTRQVTAGGRRLMGRIGPNDAEFIAHSRTDIPDLLAEVDTLTARVGELERERDSLRAQIPHPGDGSCDHCGAIPAVDIPTSLCEECRKGVARAESAERRVSELVAQNQGLVEELQAFREMHNLMCESHKLKFADANVNDGCPLCHLQSEIDGLVEERDRSREALADAKATTLRAAASAIGMAEFSEMSEQQWAKCEDIIAYLLREAAALTPAAPTEQEKRPYEK
jgi:hypothetical protein